MKVSDIMISPVVVTQKNKTVKHLRELINRKKINAIPVLTMEGEIEGIVTIRDIIAESNNDKLVEDIMTIKPHVVSIESRLQDAAKMMIKHHVHHLIVMDNGQVVGILSAMDYVNLYAN